MKQYKPRDKITQKMTREGAIEVNETQQTAERISSREQDADLLKNPEQQAAQDAAQLQNIPSATAPLPHAPDFNRSKDTGAAERVMEHLDAAHTRQAAAIMTTPLCRPQEINGTFGLSIPYRIAAGILPPIPRS